MEFFYGSCMHKRNNSNEGIKTIMKSQTCDMVTQFSLYTPTYVKLYPIKSDLLSQKEYYKCFIHIQGDKSFIERIYASIHI